MTKTYQYHSGIQRYREAIGDAVGHRLAEEVEGWSEAKGWTNVTQDMRLLAEAVAEGLDHSGTLEAEKRSRLVGWLASECIGRGRFGAE